MGDVERVFCLWVFLRKNDVTCGGFLHGAVVKNPPGLQEIGFNPWVRMIPLEKEMATHSSILAWEIPWTEEPEGAGCRAGYSPGVKKRVRHNLATKQTANTPPYPSLSTNSYQYIAKLVSSIPLPCFFFREI